MDTIKKIWKFFVDIAEAVCLGIEATRLVRQGKIEDAKDLYHWY